MRVLLICTLMIAGLFACQSEYRQMVEEELASGVRQDSIFLGIYFGMSSQEFYTHCWLMNRRELFVNGPTNQSVQFDISKELKYPGKMNFYPTFHQDSIYEMPVMFTYDAFAWEDEYGADSLLQDVRGMMERWYGEFHEFTHPDKGSVYVNIQGNRQIRLFKNNLGNSVNAIFTDLSVKSEVEEQEKGVKPDES